MAIRDYKSAIGDLDNAITIDSRNVAAWTNRGLAYERLGDKDRAAGSYAKALELNKDFEPAKQGFARVGGQAGQTYNIN